MRASLTLSTTLCLVVFYHSAWAKENHHHQTHHSSLPPTSGGEHIIAHTSHNLPDGGGLIRPQHGTQARSTIERAYMDTQPPGASAFQLINMVPGANVATSDPFGISPQTNLTVRGLNGDAIGYVLEGMPLNDVAYYGGYPNQFADTENYSEVSLQQGSADLNSPVLNAAGGLMSLHFLDPSLKPGGNASFSYGSHNARRGFVRLETGEIGRSGVRAFASYSNTHADNWRGAGNDNRDHIDFKILKEWGHDNHVSLLGSWNRAITSYYPHTSLDDWHRLGIHNNFAKHYDANDSAGGSDYWKLWRDPEETLYVGAPMHFTLSQHVSLDITPYGQSAYGNAPSGTSLSTTGNYLGTQPITGTLNLPDAQDGTATVRNDYTQRSYRSGVNMALHAHYRWNDFVLGYWYDYSDDNEQSPYTAVDSNGYSQNIWGDKKRDRILLNDGSPLLAASFHTMAQVNAIFIGDHMSFLKDRLAIDVGFKEVMLSRWGTNNLPGPQYRVTNNSSEPLPRLGLRWNITQKDQLFLNATTNFRAPAVTAYYDTYSLTSSALAGTGTGHIKNEYSIAEEFGYRRTGEWITGSITFFNYNFTHRQVTTQNNAGTVSYTINAGGQTSRGVDIELGTRPWHHISPYASFEYLHATIDNDLPSNGDYLPTKGKKAIRSPSVQMAVGLHYDDGHFFSMFTAHYTGRQYATFMNDERMPSFITADLSVGYRFNNISKLHHPTMRLNFLNITNQHYLSGVSSTQFSAHDTRGRHGTLIAGQSPNYYIGGGFAVLFTASTGF
ncbi:TonB-dependent receptor [Saccharibacter sp. 17.LH.SD]|uniref:TonB-dependent receptor n=1 Tax=Saccharibacter sp. 17.LH.SD TaxID=2689393 RepID=UPI001371F225|nr:TonB-dependent receptor [Saccharibacter sp. 17.LH.SD]MXV43613.1 TonB-dependent receptor [Saccharibacter sp. 17.LH.SD]